MMFSAAMGRARMIFIAGVALATPAMSGPVMIGPLRLELGPHARVASVTLTNRGGDTMNFQAHVVAWSQAGGGDEKTPTEDIIVSPAISELPPGRAQIFRVGLRHPLPTGAERAYRVLLTDVTPPPAPGSGGPAISFRIVHSIPLFVQTGPAGKANLNIDNCPAPAIAKTVCVRARNDGTVHALVKRVTFTSGAWSQVVTPNTVLLAGGAVSFTVPRPVSIDHDARIAVTVDAEGGGATGAIGGPPS